MKTPVLESGMVSIQDFNLFYKSTDGNYSQEKISLKSPFEKYTTLEESVAALPNDIAIYSYKYSEDLYIPIRLTNALPNAINEELPEVKGESQVSVSTYNLIVGCFGSESNAKNLVSTLKSKGFSSQILDISNGLYRVSIGAANSVDEMQKISQTATAQGFEGWVLKK
jgi:cell division protein FtsN